MTSISVTRSGTVLVPTQYPVWDWVPWGPSSREGAASLLQWPLLYVSTTHFLGQATPVPKGTATPASYGDSAAGRVCHPCGSQVRPCPPEPAVEVKSRIPNTWGGGVVPAGSLSPLTYHRPFPGPALHPSAYS